MKLKTIIGNILKWVGGVLCLPVLFLVFIAIIAVLSFFTFDPTGIVLPGYASFAIASFFWGLIIGGIGYWMVG